MVEILSETKTKKTRQPKTELESKSFKDGAIYLFKRADYKKPTWFCRVKVQRRLTTPARQSVKGRSGGVVYMSKRLHQAVLAYPRGEALEGRMVAPLTLEDARQSPTGRGAYRRLEGH